MLFNEIKTASNLKFFLAQTKSEDHHYFDRDTMRFFGDTMRNYGIRRHPNDVIELYRRRSTRCGNKASAYWRGVDGGRRAVRMFPELENQDNNVTPDGGYRGKDDTSSKRV